ncbi:MAG: 4-hydroxythreonine-4-phosphate dehydrogenase PdxA [Candidatus Omnitrophota bacterium]
MAKPRLKVAITMGDPSGIGPEVILKALPQLADAAAITVIGDGRVFSSLGRLPDKIKGVRFLDLKNVPAARFSFGKARAEYGKASIAYLDKSLQLLSSGESECLVTAPICKEAIKAAGFKFSGHTEYLADRTKSPGAVMMLLNRYLKFSLLTRHVPLKDISGRLTREELTKVTVSTYRALKNFFCLEEPRISVCGLNPHASDNGAIGKEENLIIKPALRRLKSRIKFLKGPLPADVAVAGAYAGDCDAVIAIYHDQALIPLKLSDPLSGVNMTLGLPFLRTSPLHGTAFDIAGRNIARPDSMISAVRLAIECSCASRHRWQC